MSEDQSKIRILSLIHTKDILKGKGAELKILTFSMHILIKI